MATATVENYLKAIFLVQEREPGRAVATGRIAETLEVVPGTATAMMKTLADTGLIEYEPYTGARLTDAGRRLAARVLRRHRLVELFLVQVMGMGWSEVHEEAEILEHAVSDRLVERMDRMLGNPTVDPHGDPIPDTDGRMSRDRFPSLMECPLQVECIVRRVTDQRGEFLERLESFGLMPGRHVRVGSRDELAETVEIQSMSGDSFALGFRAASRVLVAPTVS